MPKTLADSRIRLTILTEAPADFKNPKVAELNKGINASCKILKSDYRLSATGSDTINEPALCAASSAETYGPSRYEASLTPFRYLNADGKTAEDEDVAYQAMKEKGTHLYLVEREGPAFDKDFEAGDIVDIYEVITDTPQKPSDRSGYIKRTVPMAVQRAAEGVTVSA